MRFGVVFGFGLWVGVCGGDYLIRVWRRVFLVVGLWFVAVGRCWGAF